MASEKAVEQTPAVVRVGPFSYEVSFDGEAAYDYGYSGVCLYRSRRLKLDPRQADTELRQTFLHELIHAIGNAWEIREWDRHTLDDKQQTTDKIDLMASALLTLKANPAVVRWLIEEDKAPEDQRV